MALFFLFNFIVVVPVYCVELVWTLDLMSDFPDAYIGFCNALDPILLCDS